MAQDLDDNELEELSDKISADMKSLELTLQGSQEDFESIVDLFAGVHDSMDDSGQSQFKTWMRG